MSSPYSSTYSKLEARIADLERQLKEKDEIIQRMQAEQIRRTHAAIERLCNQLQGHVSFLIRLATTPDVLSLFLINDDGKTFLDDATRHLLLEQAGRTTKLLTMFKQHQSDDSALSKMLSLETNSDEYIEQIRHCLEDDDVTNEELKALLKQELMVNSALANTASKLKKGSSGCLDDKEEPIFMYLCDVLGYRNIPYTQENFIKLIRKLVKRVKDNNWSEWARRLYISLLNDEQSDEGIMKKTIEEAALSSIGVVKLPK